MILFSPPLGCGNQKRHRFPVAPHGRRIDYMKRRRREENKIISIGLYEAERVLFL
jgi:hypothetical protein